MPKITLLILLITNFISLNLYSQTLPPERATNWQLAGLSNPFSNNEAWINVLTAGADAEGLLPVDNIINAILSDLDGSPATLFFPPGIYLFNQTLSLPSNITLQGTFDDDSVLRFDLDGSGHLITAIGEGAEQADTLLNDALKDANFLAVNNSGFYNSGDVIKLLDNDADLVTSSWAENSTGQIVTVSAVNGDTLFLNSPLRRDFLSEKNAVVAKLNLLENILLENLTIERLDATETQTSNVFFSFVKNSKLECIKSFNCNFAHVDIRNSTNIEVAGSWLQDGFDYGGGGKAYGVVLHLAAGECLVTENIFNHLRHSILLQAGANGNVISFNYSYDPFWTDVVLPSNSAGDLVLHGNYPYANLFESNVVQNIIIDNSHGTNGPFNTFFRNRAELYGIFMNSNPASDQQNFIGNEITNETPGLGFYLLSGNDHFEYGNNVVNELYPQGEDDIPEASLYLNGPPDFYESISNWPPIGFPNSLNENPIEAALRNDDGLQTSCMPAPLGVNTKAEIESAAWYLFPNPVVDILQLTGPENEINNIEEIRIYTLDGRLKSVNKNLRNLIVVDLPEGLYFLKIKLKSGKHHLLKFVKTISG